MGERAFSIMRGARSRFFEFCPYRMKPVNEVDGLSETAEEVCYKQPWQQGLKITAAHTENKSEKVGRSNKMEARNDLNRLGLFSELGYISIGDPYAAPNSSKCLDFGLL